MPLNLLSDPWIPTFRNGDHATIRPDQIAEPGITRLAWERADFNLACLELLIGLVSMAAPPRDDGEWHSRLVQPDAGRLREALAPFASHFELAGNGPRFLQDSEPFERAAKSPDVKTVDMLYIDSAGNVTASKNADLMVKRDRFTSVGAAEAAMAIYTLQAFAPTGGAGNRTSMRGGGPMTTLIQPLGEDGRPLPLWQLVFANVLPGAPLAAGDSEAALPWLRPTRTSEKGQIVTQEDAHPLEAFFGMPRRLRLVFRDEQAVGVVQRPYGTNYAAWEHPLTPYYRQKEDAPEWLPVHPRPGRLSYRNWLGVTMESARNGQGTRRTARTVHEVGNRFNSPRFELIVGGWAMDNMKPLDFVLHTYPGFRSLGEDGEERVHQLVDAASTALGALRKALKAACRLGGAAADQVAEGFFAGTEEEFSVSILRITKGTGTDVEVAWHRTLRNQAIHMFDQRVLDGLTDHDIAGIERRVIAKRNLLAVLKKQLRQRLGLPIPGGKEEGS